MSQSCEKCDNFQRCKVYQKPGEGWEIQYPIPWNIKECSAWTPKNTVSTEMGCVNCGRTDSFRNIWVADGYVNVDCNHCGAHMVFDPVNDVDDGELNPSSHDNEDYEEWTEQGRVEICSDCKGKGVEWREEEDECGVRIIRYFDCETCHGSGVTIEEYGRDE